MTYIKQSVPRAAGSPGIGIQSRDSLTVIDIDDILYCPPRDGNGVKVPEDIIMRPNRYAVSVYMTPGTVEVTSAAEGETDQIGFLPQVKFNHPGNELPVREFKANWLNKKCIVIVRYCSGKPADIIGSICNPCKMTPSYTGNNDGNTNEITFQQISKGDDIGIYAGTIPEEEPVAVVESGVKTVDFIAEGQYQLSAGDAAITKIEGGTHDAVITLLGVAGTAPTVAHSPEAILLKGGKVFNASEGSHITLRAFEVGAGEFIWIEQSRYEAV